MENMTSGMPEPTFAVVITPKDIYDAVMSLTGQVRVLIEQQTHTVKEVEETQKELRELKKDFEDRLRSLEKTRWPLPSIAILVSLAAIAVTVILKFI